MLYRLIFNILKPVARIYKVDRSLCGNGGPHLTKSELRIRADFLNTRAFSKEFSPGTRYDHCRPTRMSCYRPNTRLGYFELA